jgi:phage shock protein A
MERKVADLEKDVAGWQGRAEQALKLGDEALARAALKRKSDHNERLIDLKTALAEQNALVDQMMGHVRESKNRLKALNLRRSSLMAQARAAKRGLAPGQISDGGTGQRMNDIENRIAEIEALNEVHAELHGDTVEEAAMDAKLAALSGDTEVDDALAELKAKLNAEQKSLPSKDD